MDGSNADSTAVADDPKIVQYGIVVTFVVPHNPDWKSAFSEESAAITVAFQGSAIEIHHIGSTAIPGVLAKPIIDLLSVVTSLADVDENSGSLEALGYEVMGAYGIEGRRYFRKTNYAGTRTHHLHIFEVGSLHVERHLAFRDYLIAHPSVSAEYSLLKESLTSDEGSSCDNYLNGKDPFISDVEQQAVDWFRTQTQK
ncbi:MAG: GrpB family protein [Pseudomonadota bacterium]